MMSNDLKEVENLKIEISQNSPIQAGDPTKAGKKKKKKKKVKTGAALNDPNSAESTSFVRSIDILHRLAPPVLFFGPDVTLEYVQRFTNPGALAGNTDGREGGIMRRLIAMMAGILSKASTNIKSIYSRIDGEARRNGFFQKNLNTSLFTLFSTLSATGGSSDASKIDLPTTTHIAKDSEPIFGYSERLANFWRKLTTEERMRLVQEEKNALKNAWIELDQNWCLCIFCKHRRMTTNDLTDYIYQAYYEELDQWLQTKGSTGDIFFTTSSVARCFLFKCLSIVGENSLLPRSNQFIQCLEAFSTLPISEKVTRRVRPTSTDILGPEIEGSLGVKFKLGEIAKKALHSTALKASRRFLRRSDDKSPLYDPSDDEFENFNPCGHKHNTTHGPKAYDFDADEGDYNECNDGDNIVYLADHDGQNNRSNNSSSAGANNNYSEDDEVLIDTEINLSIDENELSLPGGASFPIEANYQGYSEWPESSRIECGRTIFLMFASEMFQYRIAASYLENLALERQKRLLEEVEEEQRRQKEKEISKALAKQRKKERQKISRLKALSEQNQPDRKEVPISQENSLIPEEEETGENHIRAQIEDPLWIEECALNAQLEGCTLNAQLEECALNVRPEECTLNAQIKDLSQVEEHACNAQIEEPSDLNLEYSTLFIDDDDDFNPTELIEQLNREMNSFERHQKNYSPEDSYHSISSFFPPGFNSSSMRNTSKFENLFSNSIEGETHHLTSEPPGFNKFSELNQHSHNSHRFRPPYYKPSSSSSFNHYSPQSHEFLNYQEEHPCPDFYLEFCSKSFQKMSVNTCKSVLTAIATIAF